MAGVFGQRYDSAGSAQGSEFLINTCTLNAQLSAAVAADPSGSFFVTCCTEAACPPAKGLPISRSGPPAHPDCGGSFRHIKANRKYAPS